MRRSVIVSPLLLGALAAWPPAALIDEALGSLASLDADLAAGNLGAVITRDLARCAWIALAVPRPANVSAAVRYLSILFAAQLPDGQFPWLLSEHNMTDPNAINFVAMPLAAVWLQFDDALGPAFQTRYATNVSAAVSALVDHTVAVSYSNIFTMRLAAELVLGAALNDSSLWSQGVSDWGGWASEVSTFGIHEFDSPTYSQVTLDNLVTAAVTIRAHNKSISDELGSGAAYVSACLLAEYVPRAAGSLGGSHSRDYDFLFGDGAVGHLFELANATGAPPASVSNQGEGIYETVAVLLGYDAAPAAALRNASIDAAVRVVQKTYCPGPSSTAGVIAAGRSSSAEPCSSQPGADTYSYFLRGGTALATASSYYGPQDKQVVGLLAPPPGPNAETKLVQVRSCRAPALPHVARLPL